LQENTDPLWKLFGSKPVVGRVSPGKFSGYKRIFYGNSFRTIVFADVSPGNGGTVLTLRFGMSRFVVPFMTFWFTGVLLTGGAASIMAVKDFIEGKSRTGEWIAFIVPPLMIIFGIALVAFGRWLGRDERPFLIDFFKNTLSAN
jgi:hypothetical protein